MGMIRSPRVLDNALYETQRLEPVDISLRLPLLETRSATIVLPDSQSAPPIHSLVEIYTLTGSAGIFRVTGEEHQYTQQTELSLLHVIDILSDQLIPTETEYTGSVEGFIRLVLSYQTTRITEKPCWQLGVCEDTASYTADIRYDSLLSLLRTLQEHEQDYFFDYDTSTFPWTLNFRHKSGEVASEFRLARNMLGCRVAIDDTDMCTRLYLSIDTDELDDAGIAVTNTTQACYDNANAQAHYGVIAKTASINTASYPDPAAFAARYLADRAQPAAQITVDGLELTAATGEVLDECHLGMMCRVALPDYHDTFEERIMSVSYPGLITNPQHVTLELANAAYTATASLSKLASMASDLADETAAVSRFARGSASGAAQSLSIIDGTLEAAGLVVDKDDGVWMFAKGSGAIGTQLMAEVKINREYVTATSRAIGAKLDENGEIVRDENGKIVYDATSAAEIYSNLSLAINRAQLISAINNNDGDQISGAKVDLSAQGIVLIEAINADQPQGTKIQLKAARINLDGYATMENVHAEMATLETAWSDEFSTNSLGAGSANFNELKVNGTLWTSYLSAENVMETIFPHTHTLSESGGVVTLGDVTRESPQTFNIAETKFYKDGVSAAVASVTIDNADIVLDGEPTYQGGKYHVYVEVTASNGNQGTNDLTFVPTEAYDAGKKSAGVTGSWTGTTFTYHNSTTGYTSDSGKTTIWLDTGSWSTDGNYTRGILVKNGDTLLTNQDISAKAVFDVGYEAGKKDGWNACIDACAGHTVWEGVTVHNPDAIKLYVAPTTSAAIASGAARVWKYGGSQKTYYSLPDKK